MEQIFVVVLSAGGRLVQVSHRNEGSTLSDKAHCIMALDELIDAPPPFIADNAQQQGGSRRGAAWATAVAVASCLLLRCPTVTLMILEAIEQSEWTA